MSKHDWERGEILLSVKEFGPFRREMIAFHNQRSADLFVRAQQVYKTLKITGKGKRGFDYHSACEAIIAGAARNVYYTVNNVNDVDGISEIFDSIFPNEQVEGIGWTRSRRPKAPKRSQFTPLKTNTESVPVGDEAGISFDKKRRVVIWNVSENNHAVERAHEHSTGKEFFKLLGRVEWTRGTGGEIVGNDEYNREASHEGGGGNYVTGRYGAAERKYRESFLSRR